MKYIKSKKISKQKYELTLEVSIYDFEMLEDLATTLAPFLLYDKHKEDLNFDYTPCEFNERYQKWITKMWKIFWTPINKEYNKKQ